MSSFRATPIVFTPLSFTESVSTFPKSKPLLVVLFNEVDATEEEEELDDDESEDTFLKMPQMA